MRLTPILAILFALLCLAGCTDEQLRQTGEAVVTAETWHERAVQAEQIARKALDQAKALAEKLDSEKADRLIAQAEAALAAASSGVEVAGGAVQAAKSAHAAAQAAHDSGGGTWQTISAAVVGLLSGAALLFPKLRGVSLALSQVVRGVQAVRKAKGEEAWKAEIAPALAESTDDAAKKQVAAMLAKI